VNCVRRGFSKQDGRLAASVEARKEVIVSHENERSAIKRAGEELFHVLANVATLLWYVFLCLFYCRFIPSVSQGTKLSGSLFPAKVCSVL
jgi:hypothetical protein